MKSEYLSILETEKSNVIKNGLYDYTAVNFTFYTNKIEGSTLTLSDTQSLYEHDMVHTGGHKMDDLIEGRNHFQLFDFMLDTIEEPFSERLIKEYHRLLKKGTSDDERYGIGKYKSIPNIVGNQEVAQPHEVPDRMNELMGDFNNKNEITLLDILDFHYNFETIHPFQDGNGRVGRMIMFRQCLCHNIAPFIISSERREEYINGLVRFPDDPGNLKEEVMLEQKAFKKIAAPFVEHYGVENDIDHSGGR
jgi:Fic family protein